MLGWRGWYRMRTVSRTLVCWCSLLVATLVGCGGSGQAPPVPPMQDFTLALSVQSVFAPVGVGSGSVQVSVQAVNGYDQAVSVSLSGLPSGVSTSPALPVMVNPGSNQTITIMAASNTPVGVQNVAVNATSGSLNHSASFALSVAAPSYAYVATGIPGQPPYDLVGFAVDANTGALTQVPGSPMSLPNAPVDLAVASESGGGFVFALMPETSGQMVTVTLQSYSIDAATGAVAPLQTITYPPNTGQHLLAVSPSQNFLYVTQSGCVLAYTIDPATGNLTQSSCSPQGVDDALAIPAPGNFAYTLFGDSFSSTWSIYSVNQNDGTLTLLQSFNSTGAGFLFTDPQGRALYQLAGPPDMSTCGSVVIWQINPQSGALTHLNTSFTAPCESFAIAFNPADTYGYVSSAVGENHPQNGIYAGSVDTVTGNLNEITGSPFASGSNALAGAVEPSQGKYLTEEIGGGTVGDNNQVAVYAIDSGTGALSAVSGAQSALPSSDVIVFKMLAVSPAH